MFELPRKILAFKKSLQAMEDGQRAKKEKRGRDMRQHIEFIHLFIGLYRIHPLAEGLWANVQKCYYYSSIQLN